MAKTETPKKTRWYRSVWDAFQFVRANDRKFLPMFLVLVAVFIGGGIALGFVQGGIGGHISSNLIGVALAALAGIILLSARIEKAAFTRFEGMFGGSLPAVQTIRRGWKFEDDPIEVDAKGRAVVFQGVGRGGLVLIGEGDTAARRLMVSARQRLQRIVPGVAIHEFYVGKGQGQTPLPGLPKAIKKLPKVLDKREREAVGARMRALGGTRLPIPKGIDPSRARPSRKAVRGR
jgi:hypothetical protein